MRPPFRRSISLFIALIYFVVQTPLAYASENNFWKNRASTGRKTTEVAALPVGFAATDALEKLPRISSALRSDLHRNDGVGPADVLPPALAAIPAGAARVRNVFAPAGDRRLVLLIQDVHFNEEAQRNIARTLSAVNQHALAETRRPVVVAVEAAFGSFDFSSYRTAGVDGTAVNDLLAAGKIAAASFLGLTAESPPAFVGGEDLGEYRANVQAYLDATREKESVAGIVAAARAVNRAQKAATLSDALKLFDEKMSAFQDGPLSFSAYVAAVSAAANAAGLPVDADAGVLLRFTETAQMEKGVDFQKAEQGRRAMLEKWASKASPEGLARVMEDARAFQRGQRTAADFYDALATAFRAAGLAVDPSTDFSRYLAYVRRASGIDAAGTLEALGRVEAAVIDRLAASPDERHLMAMSRKLALAAKLAAFQLTPDEWTRYAAGPALALTPAQTTALAPFERFYTEADARSDRMVKVIAGAAGRDPSRTATAAILSGGFHAERMAELLRKRGVPHAIVQPVLTKLDGSDATAYLSAFLTEQVSVERLFRGERLFLAFFGQNVGNVVADRMNPEAGQIRERIRSAPRPGQRSWRESKSRPSWGHRKLLVIATNLLAALMGLGSAESRFPSVDDRREDEDVRERTSRDDGFDDGELRPETDEEYAVNEVERQRLRVLGAAILAADIGMPEDMARVLGELSDFISFAGILPAGEIYDLRDKVLARVRALILEVNDESVNLPNWEPGSMTSFRVLLESPMLPRMLELEASTVGFSPVVNPFGVRAIRQMYLRALGFNADPTLSEVGSYFGMRAQIRTLIEASVTSPSPYLNIFSDVVRDATPDVQARWARFFLLIARDYNLPLATRIGSSLDLFVEGATLTVDGQVAVKQAFRDAIGQRGPLRDHLLGWLRPALESVLGEEEAEWFREKIATSSEPEALMYLDFLKHRTLSKNRPPFNVRYAASLNRIVQGASAPVNRSRGPAIVIEVMPFDGMGDLDLALIMARYMKQVYPRRDVILAYQHVSNEASATPAEPASDSAAVDQSESSPSVNTAGSRRVRFASFSTEPEKLAALMGVAETAADPALKKLSTVVYPSGRLGVAEQIQMWKPAELGGLAVKLVPHTRLKEALGQSEFVRLPVMASRPLDLYGVSPQKEVGVIALATTAGPNIAYVRTEEQERGQGRSATLIDLANSGQMVYAPGGSALDFPFFATPIETDWSAADARGPASKEMFRGWTEFDGRADMFAPDARWMYAYWSPATNLDLQRSLSMIGERIAEGWTVVIKISEGQWNQNLLPVLKKRFTADQLARIVPVTKGKSKTELRSLMEASDWVHASGTGTMREALLTMARFGKPVTYMSPEWHVEMVGQIVESIKRASDADLPAESRVALLGFYEEIAPDWYDAVSKTPSRRIETPRAVTAEDTLHFKRLGRYLVRQNDAGDRIRRLIAAEEFASASLPGPRSVPMTTRFAYAIGFVLFSVLHFVTRPSVTFDHESARAFSEQRVAPVVEVPMIYLDLALAGLFRLVGISYPEYFARWHRSASVNDATTRVRLSAELRRATREGLSSATPVALVVTGLAGALLAAFAVTGILPAAALLGAPGTGVVVLIASATIRQVRLHRVINTPADVLLIGVARSLERRGLTVGRDVLMVAARRVVVARMSALGDIHPDELERVFRTLETGLPAAGAPLESALRASPALLSALANGEAASARDGPELTLRAVLAALEAGRPGFALVDRFAEILLGSREREALSVLTASGGTAAALATAAGVLGLDIARRQSIGYFTEGQAAAAINALSIGLAMVERPASGSRASVIAFESAQDAPASLDRYRMLADDPAAAISEAQAAVVAHFERRRQGAADTLALVAGEGGVAEQVRRRLQETYGDALAAAGIRIADGSRYENAWPMMKELGGFAALTGAEAAERLKTRTARFEISPRANPAAAFFVLQASDIPDDLRRQLESRLEVVMLINAMLGVRVSLNLLDAVAAYRAVMIAA